METPSTQDKTARPMVGGVSRAPYGRVWDLIAGSCRTYRPRTLAAWWVGDALRMVAGRDATPYRLAFGAAAVEVRDGWPLVGEGEKLAESLHRPLVNVGGVTDGPWSIAHQGASWGAWRDGEVPDGWEVWEVGLTWEIAHDLVKDGERYARAEGIA